MSDIKKSEYKKFYEKVSSQIGWDFSNISKRKKVIGEKWDLLKVVKEYTNKNTILLDVGTGGGEKLIKMAKFIKKAFGIDNSKNMIITARKNLAKVKKKNIEFKYADAKKLPFSNKYFDAITCIHSPFYVKEVSRVLKPTGIFITQQVGEKDKKNLKKIFGRGQAFGKKDGALMNKYLQQLKKEGFRILRKEIYNAKEYYKNIEDLIFLLEHTPIIPGFNRTKDKKNIETIRNKHIKKDGIQTNAYRFLIVAQKND